MQCNQRLQRSVNNVAKTLLLSTAIFHFLIIAGRQQCALAKTALKFGKSSFKIFRYLVTQAPFIHFKNVREDTFWLIAFFKQLRSFLVCRYYISFLQVIRDFQSRNLSIDIFLRTNCKEIRILFKIFGTSFSSAGFQTCLKQNVLAMQLFIDLIRFMFGWSLYLSIIPEIASSSRERVWVEKRCLFGIFKIGIFIKYSLKVLAISTYWDRIL